MLRLARSAVKQSQSIEVAHLVNGEVVSVRRLSRRSEWRSALAAFGLVALMSRRHRGHRRGRAAGRPPGRCSCRPTSALWAVVGVGARDAWRRRAPQRARALVQHRGGHRRRRVRGAGASARAPNAGWLPAGARARHHRSRRRRPRAPLAVEALVRAVGGEGQGADLPLERGMRAEVAFGPTTFVVRALRRRRPASRRCRAGFMRRFARRALVPLQLAALGSFFCAVPVGATLGEADMKSAIPRDATPWEIEKALRAEAQTQARSLHQCFDVLPITCQHSGYVGVGLSLSREGEMRDHWIARSTYGADCPVEQCMSEVRLDLVLRAAARVDAGDPAGAGPAHRQAAALRPGARGRRSRTDHRPRQGGEHRHERHELQERYERQLTGGAPPNGHGPRHPDGPKKSGKSWSSSRPSMIFRATSRCR